MKFIAYNKKEDFRMVVDAWNKADAIELAEEYRADAGLDGKFVVEEPFKNIDCDYVVTYQDGRIFSEEARQTLVEDYGLEAEKIDRMSRFDALRKALHHRGIIGYTGEILTLIEQIWGIELED